MNKGIASVVGNTDFIENNIGIITSVIDKMDGQQIVEIITSAFKCGTVCYVAHTCGVDGIKTLVQAVNDRLQSTKGVA